MSLGRDARVVLFVSIVGIALALTVFYTASKRIHQWQNEFALSNEDPVSFSASLFMEHYRLLKAMTDFVRGDEQTSKVDVAERLDIYWSRFQLFNVSKHMFDAPEISHNMSWLPLDSHSKILQDSSDAITQASLPALHKVERLIKNLQRGDYQGYMQARAVLDSYGDSLATLQIASFERQRYLDAVQVALSEQLRSQFRNALLGISLSVILLSYLLMLYLRHRHIANVKQRDMNDQLRSEITESARLAEKLSFQATHDSLSGLVNRYGFNQALDKQLAHSKASHGLCFIDLDMFKVVNDTCGHAAGDELICQTASLLRRTLPESAVVARFGGDEFVILICDCEKPIFENIIRSCCKKLKQHVFENTGRQFNVSGSFGAAYFNTDDLDKKTQMGIVDAACYAAKNAGGARVHFHNRDDASFAIRQHDLHVVSDIQTALAENKFCLYRQPIVSITDKPTSRPDHWEVLIRMSGDDNEPVLPGRFLDVAERYGLASRIDKWVIEATFRWLNATCKHERRQEHVNINLSGMSIGDNDFLTDIENLTLTLDIPTTNVCFEITESASMGRHAIAFLRRLKELGYQLALDDFGTGFSSFGYLESLPVDYIKIDGLFVRDMINNQSHGAFVKSINDIGKVMGKQTVAEYVECPASLSLLKAIGVDFAQGYQIARPSPMAVYSATDQVVELQYL